ncbi:Leucine-, isoleucine-, valine-, threonine-, and alanine-binding protein [Mycolicibacterium vanbaalenii]|uniref:Leucine-, isoleucine-, valine-, threonine-, and alanine-binding protein n=1 Tax=Mycolicibacterium vanbaalenii TaxID=110539 RepID=A0A5S9QVI0_MYCVN|nr:branched-chain amino acid ABC transporter substrate-binding protein [Mycolicibacterium vanbaalenii]CAA0123897.1 Leucine-, isoleucine-, valine-, threonine-, and alanine-binding protein [Mycolicibacterium vanbaalenii]
MRCRGVRGALALGSAALVALGSSACGGAPSVPGTSPEDLTIEAQVQIDRNGAVVEGVDGPEPARPAGDGNAVCPPLSIAMAGDLGGPDAAMGTGVMNGVQLAVDQHNEANPACQVQLKPFDTEGDPARGAEVAAQIVDDAYTVGVVGPATSGETLAAGGVFDRAGLVAVTPSATSPALSEQGWRTFFRGVADDEVQGPAVADYMTGTLGHRKVCVVDDSSDYGLGLASTVRETLGAMADSACNIAIRPDDTNFSGIVPQITSAAPDSVFFAGYYPQAAALVAQLRDAGFEGAFVGADGVKTVAFVDEAGSAANGAVLSCPCSPAPPDFVDEYRRAFDEPPPSYSVEAYDLGTILLKGIDSGAITRPALLQFVRDYDGQGIARRYRWTATGELTDALIWIYRVVE